MIGSSRVGRCNGADTIGSVRATERIASKLPLTCGQKPASVGPSIVLANLTFFLVTVRAGSLSAAALELGIRWRPPASAGGKSPLYRPARTAGAAPVCAAQQHEVRQHMRETAQMGCQEAALGERQDVAGTAGSWSSPAAVLGHTRDRATGVGERGLPNSTHCRRTQSLYPSLSLSAPAPATDGA